jgi:hypothetical protein
MDNARHAYGQKFANKGGLDESLDRHICSLTRGLAEKFKLSLCDLHEHFKKKYKEEPGLIEKLLLRDGVHMSDDGNRAMAEFLGPAIADLVKEKQAGASAAPDIGPYEQ